MPAPMPPPPSMPGSSTDAVPVKPMPKRPLTKQPAGFYRDVRIAAAEEEQAHAEFLDRLTDSIWKQVS